MPGVTMANHQTNGNGTIHSNSDGASSEEEKQLACLERECQELKAMFLELKREQRKPQRSKWLLPSLVIVFIGMSIQFGWNEFTKLDFHNTFYEQRVEYLFLHSMSKWKKLLWLKTPFMNEYTKELLASNLESHTSHQEYYDPTKHDRPHRRVVPNVLNRQECAQIRTLLQRQKLSAYSPESDASGAPLTSLALEFGESSVLDLVGMFGKFDDVTQEERELLYSVLERVQKIAESTFASPHMYIDYSAITLRRSPVRDDSKEGWFKRKVRKWHYQTTGGHGVHADQCVFPNDVNTHAKGYKCVLDKNHCCAFRTHSVLLYLNDEESDLVGGDLYMVDRPDSDQENAAYSSEIGFAKALQRTLRVKPTCGNLALFTSDARNLHGTYPIQEGSRFAMPMWFTSPKDVPVEQNPALVHDLMGEEYSENGYIRDLCRAWQKGIVPVPSGFEHYLEDCEDVVEIIQDVSPLYE